MDRTVLTTAVLVLALAGCGGGEPDGGAATTGSASAPATSSTPPPATSTTSEPPLPASPELPQGLVAQPSCQPLDPRLQTAIDASLRAAGSALAAAQMIGSPDGTIYAGGDVLLADGTRASEADVWVFPVAGQALFSVSEGAIALSEWPDGRDALGVGADDATGTALIACITAAR